ncbi:MULTISPECIES: membrane protein YczE [Nocardiopsis]|uniref:membrane protein YczE n=1 Tax=Nocardiopsis TaxID=2013 RepID=UPI00034AFDC4|nr:MULTISPECIES: membrane protein [Nocardiopsis]PWV54789.1 putative membrane protein YczE [Nocardiopsis sp. L17-MgMaSL7]
MSEPPRSPLSALARRLLITPVLPRPRLRRLAQLYLGLYLYGLSGALLIRSDLGAMPWDVLHQGLSRQTGLSIGTWSVIVGALLILLWIPLRQKAGLGTLSNVVMVGASVDLSLWLLPATDSLPVRVLLLASGVLVCAVATGLYIGVGLGPGPRDGLMTGLAARGLSVRLARTLIEVAVALSGFLLGGTVGVGTVVFMVTIGPLAQVFLPMLRMPEDTPESPTLTGR